ncbi:hypothetical protein PFISCL1PPCAC_17708, partial [Pristionchus fissidentatus]
LSQTINTLLQVISLDDSENESQDPIPLQNVNSAILKKVMAWCQYHKDDPPMAWTITTNGRGPSTFPAGTR